MYVSVVMFAVIVNTFHLSPFVSVVFVCLSLEKGVVHLKLMVAFIYSAILRSRAELLRICCM